MSMLHPSIYRKLNKFIDTKQIPNIIFHGENGSGKKTILDDFLRKIYNNIDDYKQYVMSVNCAEGKGIRFIRDELKFFAKTNIHNYNGSLIKSIVLLNADFLTIDAQSALRRCIELFSNFTRFFIVINDKNKLIQPMLSRFSSIYVYRPTIKKKPNTDLHTLNNIKIPNTHCRRINSAIQDTFAIIDSISTIELLKQVKDLYEKGCSGIDCINYIEKNVPDNTIKYDLLIYLETLSFEIRNEKLLMFLILKNYKMRNTRYLENIDIL